MSSEEIMSTELLSKPVNHIELCETTKKETSFYILHNNINYSFDTLNEHVELKITLSNWYRSVSKAHIHYEESKLDIYTFLRR